MRSPQRAGERSSGFEDLYARSYQEISAYVQRRVTPSDAEDVLAHVFAVAWRRFDQVPPPPQDRLWLFGVARNCVADHHRAEHRQLRLRARLSAHALTARPAAPPGSPHEPVLDAVTALPPRYREALQLVLWEELSHEQAAAVLGVSVTAFESRYRRARARVRDAVLGARAQPATPPAPLVESSQITRMGP